jgi:hypothetical protein
MIARTMLQLPIWTITEHIQVDKTDEDPCGEPGVALVFTTSSKMFQFLNANLGGEWKMAMAADRDGLVILIADFHRVNIQTLRVNPEKDGTGGEEVELAELMTLAESLKDAK